VNSIVEIIGYLASLIVLVSFLMKDIRTLRMVNMTGCLLFVVYGILLDWKWPIIVTNLAIFTINAYYLIASRNNKAG
jgi:uncharacterized protein with PQ loop repeat